MTILPRSLIVLVLLCAVPLASLGELPSALVLKWDGKKHRSVTAVSSLGTQEAKECIDVGLELEHRFLFKFCEKLERFGTNCQSTRRIVHNFSFDPIQESYRVVKDRLDDAIDPERSTHPTFDQALEEAATVHRLSLKFLGQEKTAYQRFRRGEGAWNLGVRVRTTCKGEVPEFLADLSYFLSFGMIDLYGNDTGWEYFELGRDGSGSGSAVQRVESG